MKTFKPEPLSKETLLKRGSCCKFECKNCPWGYKKEEKKENESEIIPKSISDDKIERD